jgi:hypothetical protein
MDEIEINIFEYELAGYKQEGPAQKKDIDGKQTNKTHIIFYLSINKDCSFSASVSIEIVALFSSPINIFNIKSVVQIIFYRLI